jgi:hypothetical protein
MSQTISLFRQHAKTSNKKTPPPCTSIRRGTEEGRARDSYKKHHIVERKATNKQKSSQKWRQKRKKEKLWRITLIEKSTKVKEVTRDTHQSIKSNNRITLKTKAFNDILQKKYGFLANPSLPTWKHLQQIIFKIPSKLCFNQPCNNSILNLYPRQIFF